ncbi:coat protein [Idiomarina sp. WRN-38]|nr:coat protein [Idiomarina sp. H105]OAE96014.1 coat protein [Idiomarina sp. WRN-38]
MSTKISDVIVPSVFNPYFMQRTMEMARFYLGGIVSNDAELNRLAQSGGKTLNMPFWNDLTGADEILSDSSALTPGKINAGQDVAVLHMRGRAWSVNDLATALSGDDPMAAIADLVANYWARRYQAVALASLKGVMADNSASDSGDMIVDVAGATVADVTADTKFHGDVFIDGQATFGDALGGLSGIAFHPNVYHNLKKVDQISFERESQGDLEIETYRGLRVIVDRNLPYTPAAGSAAADAAAQYTSYLFGSGAIGMGQGGAPVPSETDRDSLAGEDILITRSHFLMHPRGVKFTSSSVAGASPTNTELEAAANWDRVYEREAVRIASIVTNG